MTEARHAKPSPPERWGLAGTVNAQLQAVVSPPLTPTPPGLVRIDSDSTRTAQAVCGQLVQFGVFESVMASCALHGQPQR